MAKTLKEKCLEKGIAYSTVRARIARGWTESKALNTPPAKKQPKVKIPEYIERPADPMDKVDAYSDGFILTIAIAALAAALALIIWMIDK
jgi:hypothetical protein